ncbi:MAG: Crp/Fnr family transcriptional regulator [Planctomycetes bacterium]|nr:Crp/Fnr family transcriptional regulator [Planctomycetota bacterium]
MGVDLVLLRETPLFANCSATELDRLNAIAVNREYKDGEVLFSLGQEAKELLVVASGRVLLVLPVKIFGEVKNISFETKGRGDVLGWSSLVPPFQFTLSGCVSGGVKIAAFPKAELEKLFENNPDFGFRIMRNLAAIVGLRVRQTHLMWIREIQRSLDERYR